MADLRGSAEAELSVVVPAVNGPDLLLETLEALAQQLGPVRIEVIVPDRNGAEARALVAEHLPDTIILPVDPGTPIPAMRRMAFERATAPVVAVIEDHIIVPSNWARAMVDAVDDRHPAVGGWVRNAATECLVDRAAFICEYGHMLRPPVGGRAKWLPGNNVAYARGLLDRLWDVVLEERWEDRLHAAVSAIGLPLTLRPDIEVRHKMHYRWAGEYAGQRFLYSRAYAAMRLRDQSHLKRITFGLIAFSLPLVVFVRIMKNGWSLPDSRSDLVKSLPLIAFFATVWALGEIAGAWFGGGDSLGRVR
jgi:glycosyltransferase involved in cell wall biosynthesis